MKTNLLVLLASLSINSLIQNVQAQEAPFRVDPTKRQFIDKFGRSVIFHGLSLTAEDIGNLKKWGLNLVRLGVMWEAVERTSGSYDQKYLDNIEKIINDLGKAGIYTMVDMHQDAIQGEPVVKVYPISCQIKILSSMIVLLISHPGQPVSLVCSINAKL